ncbi:MAG TPA: YraN family protein [Syntrophales bacterium]|nr:YraN family protein [Syntrophales bacterium]HRT62700.1 YraN family protein [Syntrophales bacterium]
MTKSRIDTGREGEAHAVRHLQREGYRIIERNYRCVFGEMDIIAREGGACVFVEVKSRRSVRFGDPKYAVDRRKQRKMSAVALCYLKEKRLLDHPARFDVVTVLFSEEGPRVELVRNAFGLAAR